MSLLLACSRASNWQTRLVTGISSTTSSATPRIRVCLSACSRALTAPGCSNKSLTPRPSGRTMIIGTTSPSVLEVVAAAVIVSEAAEVVVVAVAGVAAILLQLPLLVVLPSPGPIEGQSGHGTSLG